MWCSLAVSSFGVGRGSLADDAFRERFLCLKKLGGLRWEMGKKEENCTRTPNKHGDDQLQNQTEIVTFRMEQDRPLGPCASVPLDPFSV